MGYQNSLFKIGLSLFGKIYCKKSTSCSGPYFFVNRQANPHEPDWLQNKLSFWTVPFSTGGWSRLYAKIFPFFTSLTMIIKQSLNPAWMWKFSNAFIISGADLIWSPIAISPHSSSCHQPPPPSQPTYAPHPFSVPSTLQLAGLTLPFL